MSTLRLEKFVEDDELDLSLQNLTLVPVNDICKLSKVKSLDLSNNSIELLQNNISKLQNIKRLDLSKNKITKLPESIGDLINLEFLDLRGNNITELPLSMRNLKKLKWLDLKDNPLNDKLRAKAGKCINSEQCKQCANEVVNYLESFYKVKLENEKKKKLKEEEEALKKALDDKERKRLEKEAKNAERKRKRKEVEEQKLLKEIEGIDIKSENKNKEESCDGNNLNIESKSTKLLSYFSTLICVILLFGLICYIKPKIAIDTFNSFSAIYNDIKQNWIDDTKTDL